MSIYNPIRLICAPPHTIAEEVISFWGAGT